MDGTCDPVGAALRTLLAASHLTGPDELPRIVADSAALLGADETTVFLIDYDQNTLVPLPHGGAGHGLPIAVDGTLAGRAFTDMTPQRTVADDAVILWIPLLDGTERLGVILFRFGRADAPDGSLEAGCRSLATVVAELVMTRSRYGDLIERARRRLPLTLPAELQWTQLPPLTCATPRVAITAVLVPTNEVAGDSFDYALNGDIAHVAILDAMGHGLEATLLSAVAVGALRNARRAGLDLADTVRSMDKHLAAHFGADKFVTCIIAELDTRTGHWRWVTAGHPPALLVRQGRVVKSLESHINPPVGLGWIAPEAGEERLQPGDRLLLHSDGVVEARNGDGEFFGTARLVDFVTKEAAAGRPAPETLRRLNLAILAHQGGELQDDATTVLVEWLGDELGKVGLDS